METGNPATARRLETRILHHERMPGEENQYGAQVWRGYTYIWNKQQTPRNDEINKPHLEQSTKPRPTETRPVNCIDNANGIVAHLCLIVLLVSTQEWSESSMHVSWLDIVVVLD